MKKYSYPVILVLNKTWWFFLLSPWYLQIGEVYLILDLPVLDAVCKIVQQIVEAFPEVLTEFHLI